MSNSTSQDGKELRALKRAVVTIEQLRARLARYEAAGGSQSCEGIAVVSAACRMPGGVSSLEAFWELLSQGRETRVEVPSERWDVDAFCQADGDERAAGKICTRFGNFLEGIEDFDPHFFGITPKDAQSMDPQHRLLLEVAWETFERCGQVPQRLAGSATGVFVGITANDYATLIDRSNDAELLNAYFITGNPLNAAAGRLSYIFGLRGPAMAIDTACSSSLVAIHTAIKSLRSGECRQALAGGVNLMLSPEISVSLSQAAMLSPDGRCKTFAAAADGYARGEGCGLVLLKRLSDAVADGDTVLAVIRGSAVNQDGASSGFTVPSGKAQAELLAAALRDAKVAAKDISFVETHGTGTSIGDPIEVQALLSVLREKGEVGNTLHLGAVKALIGHLESAAGVAGFLKVVLALANKQLPPQPRFGELNPEIPWDDFPIALPQQLSSWNSERRLAIVNSFGASGTNATLVVEEAPAVKPQQELAVAPQAAVFALSAKSQQSLASIASSLREFVAGSDCDLQQLAWSFNTARPAFNYRLPIVANSKEALLEALAAGTTAANNVGSNANLRAAFLFTGQGSQFLGMGAELYAAQPIFKAAVDRCDALFAPLLGESITAVMFGKDETALRQTQLTQPAIFSIEYALYILWSALGVQPRFVLGHSIGEVTAACVAGVFSLEDAVRLVAVRAELMQAAKGNGGMLALQAGVEQTQALAAELDCDVAAFNGPNSSVLSAPLEVIAQAEALCQQRGIAAMRLDVSHAFHSAQMDAALEPFLRAIEAIRFSQPQIPIISNRSGAIAGAEIAGPQYWVDQIRRPVCFYQGVQTLAQQNLDAVIELGPKPILLNLARGAVDESLRGKWSWIASLQVAKQWQGFATGVAELFGKGAAIDWRAFAGRSFERVVLPTYPFERERCWAPHEAVVRRGSVQQENALSAYEADAPGALAGVDASRQAKRVEDSGFSKVVDASGDVKSVDESVELVAGLLTRVTGISRERLDVNTNFFELGVDSLMLVQFQQAIERAVEVRIDLQEFAQRFDTLRRLGEHLAGVGAGDSSMVERRGLKSGESLHQDCTPSACEADAPGMEEPALAGASGTIGATPKEAPAVAGLYGKKKSQANELDEKQWAHLQKLIQRYTAKTPLSKRYAAESRHGAFAHNRNSFFRKEFKELTYLLAYDKAAGARFSDIDGNEYIDITMGFGVHLLGHNPPAVQAAMSEMVQKGVAVGPLSRDAGEVAELVAELAGVDRVAFLNTGSEAVMVALRLVRAVSGKNKVAVFSGAWHGSFDGVIATGYSSGAEVVTYPLAPGTTQGAVDDIIMLRYGDAAAFETINHYRDELAAVLVEPVQSRNPSLQPKEFVQQLRALTAELGVALIFDEMITGFRIAPNGAQGWYGIEADLVTYGKIVGGGQPIGVVAGKRAYMDSLDGGVWSFGDESMPQVQPTLVAGTFNIHPLTMAAARAVLREVKAQGPSLQQQLNDKVAAMCEDLNAWYRDNDFGLQMNYFGSLFRFDVSGELELLYYHLVDRGIFVWEGRNCFLSTAHTDADVQKIVAAVKDSLLEMRRDGWLKSKEIQKHVFPLSQTQQEIWVHTRLEPEVDRAYHESFVLRLDGELNKSALQAALLEVVSRHELLRASGFDGQHYSVSSAVSPRIAYLSASEATVDALMQQQLLRRFDLASELAWRLAVISLDAKSSLLIFCAHHIAVDGWGLGVFASELAQLYQAALQNSTAALPAPFSFAQFVVAQQQRPAADAQVAYWKNLFAKVADLPPLTEALRQHDFSGKRLRTILNTETLNALEAIAKTQGSSLYAVFVSATALLLAQASKESKFFLGMPAALQPQLGAMQLIGQATTVLPLLLEVGEQNFADFAAIVQRQLLAAQSNEAGLSAVGADAPRLGVLVNCDRRVDLRFGDLAVQLLEPELSAAKVGLFFNAIVVDGTLVIDLDYSSEIFTAQDAQSLMAALGQLLHAIAKPNCITLGRLLEQAFAALPMPSAAVLQTLLRQQVNVAGQVLERAVYRQPQDELEQTVCNAVSQLLRQSDVGLDDNFFDLGGRSLTAIQLLSRLRDSLEGEVALEDVFASKTLGELCHRIRGAKLGERFAPILPAAWGSSKSAPLSFSQQRLWILQQHQETKAAYNLSQALRIRGELNKTAMEQAFIAVINRHSVLRSNFLLFNSEPRQITGPEVESFLRFETVFATSREEAQQVCQERYLKEAAHEFDLECELLIRGVLLELNILGRREYFLIVVLHHLVGDGWSDSILVQEVSTLYQAIVQERAARIAPLSISYSDYARWQRELPEHPAFQQQVAFWQNELAGMQELLELPTDSIRPAVADYAGARFAFALSPELSQQVTALCQRFAVSPFVLFSAAFAALLSRYANSRDVAFGVAVANRNRREIESLIGFFVNTVVFRWELDATQSFAKLLEATAKKAQQIFANQDVPFEHLVEILKPRRSASYQPLCQVLFAYQDMPQETRFDIAGLEIEVLPEADTGHAKFDLSLELGSHGAVYEGHFEYATSLFCQRSISELSAMYQRLLEVLCADPERPALSYSLLREDERTLLLESWVGETQEFQADQTIHSLFEVAAKNNAYRTAVIIDGQELGFEELNTAVNRLAHYLIAQGVGRNDIVGIYLPRSLQMIVSVLAVLKTGAAYLPLDTEYPEQRISFMISDAAPKVVISNATFVAALAAHGGSLIDLDKAVQEIAECSDENPPQVAEPGDRAYVVYTSGSTGRPKGVAGHHRGMINRFAWMWKKFPFAVGERIAQKTSYNFVDSLWETFGPLLQGVALIIVPPAIAKDPEVLVELLAKHKASRIVLVPSLLRAILALPKAQLETLKVLKHWTSSGESLPMSLVQEFYATFPEHILLNLYGQSEVAADCTWCDTRGLSEAGAVPLGKPIANNRLYLLDENRQLVAPGMPGEIYVGGVGVAEGYLHQPELTAERFLADPFVSQPGGVMFRTGDRARFLADGSLSYLGRVDHQVKIRGFRIELGEIERCLLALAQVKQALVVVKEHPTLGAQIVAYVVSQGGTDIATQLREALRLVLPEYMVPSHFVFLSAFPLTPNGKLNRMALPEPDYQAQSDDFLAPRSETEEKVAKIFVEVLEQKQLSIRDNFFDRGGHSLLATMVVSRVKQEFSVDFSLQQFFQTPTIEGISACLASQSEQPRISGRL